MVNESASAETRATNAVALLHHAWITGMVLTLVARKGAAIAEAFVYRLFRTQHLELFLPGLEKLGLVGEPHAVACAKYHYFSNQLGGVKVEFLRESDTKAWIRYPPPRWIWTGTAICAIPSEVNRAMLRGWHAHNGVSLGNPRLGFVCTATTVDGGPGLEGYYLEHDRELARDERLQFRDDEHCPSIDPASLPRLGSAHWPPERRAKAYRNYAMAYVRTALPVWVELLGPDEGRRLGRLCGKQVGMHCYDEVAREMAVRGTDAAAFRDLVKALLIAAGDCVVESDRFLTRSHWRLFADASMHPAIRDIWVSPLQGMLAAHNRTLTLELTPDDRLGIR